MLAMLRKTATQLLIITRLVPRLSSATRSLSPNHSQETSKRLPLTLRQLHYVCKPMLQRALDLRHNSLSEEPLTKKSSSPDNDATISGILGDMKALPPPKQVSPSYTYDCVNGITSSLHCQREHLFIAAEGHALFCMRVMPSPTNIAKSLPLSLQALLASLSATQIVTTELNKAILSLFQAYLDSEVETDSPQISLVAIEKEGVYDLILQKIELERTASRKISTWNNRKQESDSFDEFVMKQLFPPPSREFSSAPSRKHLRSQRIVFLLCLKGMPDHSTRQLARQLHHFHTLDLLRRRAFLPASIHPSFLQAPKIRCFVDCNPSGLLILQCLSQDGKCPIEWCGLLPSQLALLPQTQNQWQALSIRDQAILEGLLARALPGSDIEREIQQMTVKAELQVLGRSTM